MNPLTHPDGIVSPRIPGAPPFLLLKLLTATASSTARTQDLTLSAVEGSLRNGDTRRPLGNRGSPGTLSRFRPGAPSGNARAPPLARQFERAVASDGPHHPR